MKYFKTLATLLLFSSVISFYSCKDKTEATKTVAPIQETKVPLRIFDTPAQQNATAQNANSVWHYTCAKGCDGGAPAAGNCSTCGNPLAHNQAYHNNANNTPTTTPTSPVTNPAASATPPTPEPSQNTAGIWHYTCGNGCAGGGGSASACNSCGNTLAHNAAYHQ